MASLTSKAKSDQEVNHHIETMETVFQNPGQFVIENLGLKPRPLTIVEDGFSKY